MKIQCYFQIQHRLEESKFFLDKRKLAEYQKIQGELGASLQRLLAVSENYPELKANENFLALQDELSGTENRISFERKRYNDVARTYIRKVSMAARTSGKDNGPDDFNGFGGKGGFGGGGGGHSGGGGW